VRSVGGGADHTDADLDADLDLPLGPVAPHADPVPADVLLTGATGFLGAFLLRDLLTVHTGRIHCLVRASDHDTARDRLRAAARAYLLPEPDPERVVAVPGSLADMGSMDVPVGHVVHAAARVAFTEPYRVLRDDVTATAALLRWMRSTGVPDLSYVSSIAAIGPAVGTTGTLRELPDQPFDPAEGGYGAAKWVIEHLLRRAGADGMRVRVFRPGLILGDRTSGACNPRDLVWRVLAGGVAVGARPLDDRAVASAPVDVVSAAIAHLGREPGSVGRVYHLVDERLATPTALFERLAGAGVETKPLPLPEWQRLVADRALSTQDDTLAGVALYELDRRQYDAVDSANWREWLAATGRSAHVDGAALRRSLAYLATRPGYRFLEGI
jgi:phthiocerol/phenolphthiocerol synthesis type-I polyketide synthase E